MRRYTFETNRCGKMRFVTARGAKVAAKNQGDRHASQFRVYKCKTCLGFHLATKRSK